MKIALFVTCLADALFPQVGRATVTGTAPKGPMRILLDQRATRVGA